MRVFLLPGALVILSTVVALGCGGSSMKLPRDGGGDSAASDTADVPESDAADGEGSDAGADADAGDDADGASSDAAKVSTLEVTAAQNAVALDGCGVTPAAIPDVPAGTYTLTLTASTLTKGGVSGASTPVPSADNYLVVHVPLAAGDPNESHRFFTLNGVGANASVKLSATGTIQLMFIDSDVADNAGSATVTLSPGGYTTTVDAAMNVLAYDTGCHSTPAALVLPDGHYRVTLVDSTFSSGAGARDDFVLLRIPSEQPTDGFRYVILNEVGASHDFSPFNSETLLAWFIGASAGTGHATLSVSGL